VGFSSLGGQPVGQHPHVGEPVTPKEPILPCASASPATPVLYLILLHFMLPSKASVDNCHQIYLADWVVTFRSRFPPKAFSSSKTETNYFLSGSDSILVPATLQACDRLPLIPDTTSRRISSSASSPRPQSIPFCSPHSAPSTQLLNSHTVY
jgi:hypothetical protein